MWQSIAAQISSELDIDFQITDKASVNGGSGNLAWHI